VGCVVPPSKIIRIILLPWSHTKKFKTNEIKYKYKKKKKE
jgi:hypothetical protein